jgi:hypothetical protein
VFERFTDRARRVLVLAQEEARLLDHSYIGTEHILLGLIDEGEGLAAKALDSLGISLEAVREKVEEVVAPRGYAPTGQPPFTPRAKKVLELSLREALQLRHNYIGTEHMLLGLVSEGEGVAARVLQSLGADLPRVRQQVVQLLSGYQGPEQVSATKRPFRSRLPRHPTKVIAGPAERLGSDGIEFRIVGVLLFAEGTSVLWRLSGIPEPLSDLMKDTEVLRTNLRQDHSVAFVALTDDDDTTYEPVNTTADPQSSDEWAGSSFFLPALPRGTSHIKVLWQGATLRVEV